MNLLFLDAYYEPETIAYTHLENDLIVELIADGHIVHVICPTPTRGVTDEERQKYQRKKIEKKYDNRLIINRFWAPKEKKNPLLRACRYFWCNIRTYQRAIRQNDIDVVFSNSTPPTQGLLGGTVAQKLSKRYGKKIRFVYNLQDIFPDSLVSTGLARIGSLLWKIGRKIEDATYKKADEIILISQGFKNNLVAKRVPEEKINVISNWIDLSTVYPIDRKENRLIKEFGIDPGKFLVVYAGNFGAAQGADIVLKLAKELEEYKDIQFVIFGGGAYFEDAKKKSENLDNIIIKGLMPQERVSEVYSLGDVALITCKKGLGKAGLPSKTWSIMAANTPIIASFDMDSDLADIIKNADAGQCVQAEDVFELKNAILLFYNNTKPGIKKVKLRDFVEKNASKEKCVDRYVKSITLSK